MSKILELVKATDEAEAQHKAAEAAALQALLEARLADAGALLESEVLGEYDIEVTRHDVDAAVLRIAPRVWRGLAHFNMVTFRPGNWQVRKEGAIDGFYVGSAEDWWSQPRAIQFLAVGAGDPGLAELVADELELEAALAEGWVAALSEGDIERIRDIWQRRIALARSLFPAALSQEKQP